MFLTTIRIRRARPRTLDKHLTTAQLRDLRKGNGRPDVVEVMAHGQTVALATAPNGKGGLTFLWEHDAIDGSTTALIRNAVALMADAKAAGLCERVESPEAA